MTVKPFTIAPTPPTSITLEPDKDGTYPEGKLSFTVTCLAAPDRSYELTLQALLVGDDGKTREVDWLLIGPSPARSMTGGETQIVVITVRPTPASPRGRHGIELAIADKARPSEGYACSVPVTCEIKPPGGAIEPIKTTKLPRWLIAAIAGGGVVVGGGGIAAWKLTGGRNQVDVKPFAPLHVLTMMPGAPDLILGGRPMTHLPTIDTTAHTIDGARSPYFVQQGEYAVLFANAFSVQIRLVITGQSPLIVVASDQITVTDEIDLEAKTSSGGPGAAPVGHPGTGGAGTKAAFGHPNLPFLSSGGGGGSYGSLGAPGGTSSPSDALPGTSGARYGGLDSDPLIGGASGGNGGGASGGAGVGGGGGGALQLSSAVSIHISATINAGGGGGGGGGDVRTAPFVGGGGGGAGGEILLEAPEITISGIVAANGGGGGGGASDGTEPSGLNGTGGKPGPGAAAGGPTGFPGGGGAGSPGGDGAAGVAGAFVEALPGSSSRGVLCGGGGGGAGRIWLRYRAATPPNVRGGTISPPPGMDPGLP